MTSAVPYNTAPYAYPTMAPAAQMPCQCAECMAYYAAYGQQQQSYAAAATYGYQYAYPHAQAPAAPQQQAGAYSHNPYAYPISPAQPQPPAAYPAAPADQELNVVPKRRASAEVESVASTEYSTDSYARKSPSEKALPLQDIQVEAVNQAVGRVLSIACTNHGSSFLQCALKEHPAVAFEIVIKEVQPVMLKLLLDMHACYVVKAMLEMMDRDAAYALLAPLAQNEATLVTLCTKDLHSRRMVQFILDFCGADRCRFLLDLVMRNAMQLVRTQQGCITLQRILDHYGVQEKEAFFATVRANFMEYALDPFGNYIVQYMLTEGDQVQNSAVLATCARGQVHNMCCHKYASNVIEKCFGLVTPELQHEIMEELLNAPDAAIARVLTDRSANYVVQAAIRAASQRDVQMISTRLAPILPTIPYGKKLQQKLAKRLRA